MKSVALDFDGLLYSDEIEDTYWFEVVPRIVAEAWGMDPAEAGRKVKKLYDLFPRDIHWVDPVFWENIFGVNGLKEAYIEEIFPRRALMVKKEDLTRLKKRFKVGLWTNSPRWKVELFCRRDKLDFDFIITAGDLGFLKPDIEFYFRAAEKTGEDVVLITHDPREKVAEKIGVDVIVTQPERFSSAVDYVLSKY